jgi:hypothetical protein
VVHLTDHWRGAWLAQALRPRWSVAPARDNAFWRWSFSHQYKLPRATPRHTVELNLDALRRLGLYPEEEEKALVMNPGPEAEAKVGRYPRRRGPGAQGFHPAAPDFALALQGVDRRAQRRAHAPPRARRPSTGAHRRTRRAREGDRRAHPRRSRRPR